ncbi:S8 family serine peptidase [Caulobacter sp. 1776]|uniref:S8 family serine peptidase n=1 Tax=Caulobacter sp. 1776 TaxID=3156420 RepID=UPI003393FA85
MSGRLILGAFGALALVTTAVGQVLPGLPTPDLRDPLGRVDQIAREPLERAGGVVRALDVADLRLDRLTALVRANPRALDLDDRGQAVVRAEVLAIAPDDEALARLAAAGYTVAREERAEALDLRLVVLRPPGGLNVRAAVRKARELDPDGAYDFNHLYAGAGGAGPAAASAGSATALPAGRVGLLDGGVDRKHPAFKGVEIEQRSFAPGGGPSPHGTAVASLLAGKGYGGLGAGSRVYAADVYGSGPTGGSASAIVGALNWMAQAKAPVVNVSLVGPDNATLRAAVKALVARGCLVVAAVGNDGPAAPPLYPASYPGVVAVTGVDARGRLLPEAGKAAHIDFAALGAGVKVATPGGGAASVRGTSYAAPVVAARLAARPDLAALANQAADLGAPGPDPVFGKGLVGRAR